MPMYERKKQQKEGKLKFQNKTDGLCFDVAFSFLHIFFFPTSFIQRKHPFALGVLLLSLFGLNGGKLGGLSVPYSNLFIASLKSKFLLFLRLFSCIEICSDYEGLALTSSVYKPPKTTPRGRLVSFAAPG